MSAQAIHPSYLAAYFNAGVAVCAAEYGVNVRRLSLRVVGGRRERPSLACFDEFARSCLSRDAKTQACEDYVRVLLSGSAGRLIGLERHLRYPKNCIERLRLERGARYDAVYCHEPETDLAYSLVFAWLSHRDGGKSHVTFARLWTEANRLLRQAPRVRALDRTAKELLSAGVLEGDALREFLN